METSIGQQAPVSLLNSPSLTEKPGRPQHTGLQSVRRDRNDPLHTGAKTFCLWQLRPSERLARRWRSFLACRDPGRAKGAGARTASAAGVTALSESFCEPLVAGDQKASLASLSPPLCLFRHLDGSLAWGPAVLSASGTQSPAPIPILQTGCQALKAAPWLRSYSEVRGCANFSVVRLLMLVCGRRETTVMAPPSKGDSAV